jgi:KUP system potassium uptake protein
LSKVAHGGWLPLLIAVLVFTVMTTWRRGREIVSANRRGMEGSLSDFIEEVRQHGKPRVSGVAVFPHPSKETVPLALRANARHNHVLHETVVIVSMGAANVPHVPLEERITVDDLGYSDDGIQHVSVKLGFADPPDLPAALRQAYAEGLVEGRPADLDDASYFLSRGSIRRTDAPGMARWRKALFVVLAHTAANPAAYFALPPDSTVTMGSDVEV